jgi:hypothetical protein
VAIAIIVIQATSRDRAGRGAQLLVVGELVMKRHWLWIGCAVVAFATGCGQAVEDAQRALEEQAAEAKAAAEKATAEAAANAERIGGEAAAAVEGAAGEATAAVEGGLADAANLKVGDVDLGKDLTSLLDGLKSTLGEVKDVETAKAALPKLEEANLNLDKLVGLVDQLPAAARPALAALLKTHSATITQTVTKITGIEGVGEILKPILEQIAAKLAKAAGTEAAPAEPAPAP